MGRDAFTRSAYAATTSRLSVPRSGTTTLRGHEEVRRTGKLPDLVDPAGYGVIRRSLIRFEEIESGPYKGMFLLTVGCSMPIETRLDTSASMGDNVDRALRVLPDAFEKWSAMLPGFDVHVLTGLFNDYTDQFILNRPQFEMIAEKIVDQLTLMNPERGGGGNHGEDGHYGLFGGAYLVAAYANRIGLKRYDFTISDEPVRPMLDERELIRTFGDQVFEKCKANGFDIDRNDLPTTKEVVSDLLTQAHAFYLELPSQYSDSHRTWVDVFGEERVILLPSIDLLAFVQAAIIGLTEGTIGLDQVPDLLVEAKASDAQIRDVQRAVANIPIGAQVPLKEAIRIPRAGDIYAAKEDLWPTHLVEDLDPGEVPVVDVTEEAAANTGGPNWKL